MANAPLNSKLRDQKAMNIDAIVSKFLEGPKAVALGPSSLESLVNERLWPARAPIIAIPDNLIRLVTHVREGSIEHRNFLIRIIRHFRGGTRAPKYLEDRADNILANRIAILVLELYEAGRLEIIGEEIVDASIEESLGGLYPSNAFEIALSPKRNFLRDYLVRIYSWSKATGGIILERTRRVFSDIGHHITTLQLPDKLDHYVQVKSDFVGRMFDFRGGRAAKFFIGLVVAVAPLGAIAAGVAGVVIAFTDP